MKATDASRQKDRLTMSCQPPHAPSLKQRRSLLQYINPRRYHKFGVETVCPSCGLIEPCRHGRFSGALCWHSNFPIYYLRVVCFDDWCRTHIPDSIGLFTLIRLNAGAKPQPPYQPKLAAGPHESFLESVLNCHFCRTLDPDNLPAPAPPERRALLEPLSIQELMALDQPARKKRQQNRRQIDRLD